MEARRPGSAQDANPHERCAWALAGETLKIKLEDGKAEIPILLDGGHLCVAGAYNWSAHDVEPGLYALYVKTWGRRIGPFYASIPLAEKGMKKALKMKAGVWEQPLSWGERQAWLHDWIVKNIGGFHELIGGEWIKE